MKILVTFAVDWEFRPWRKIRPFQQDPDGAPVFRTQIADADVQAVLTGVGAQNALRTLRSAIREAPDLCVASGLAGGLKQQHRAGHVLAARSVLRQPGDDCLSSNEDLFNLAVERGAKPAETFVSVAQVVRTSRQKMELGIHADAVDMESFAVMEEMGRRRVPCVAIRSISDEVEHNMTYDFDRALDASGRIRVTQLLGQVARAPKGLFPLMRLGVESSRAAGALARHLDSYAAFLTAHSPNLDRRIAQVAL